MRAIEFNSRIEENKILIPRRMQSEFFAKDDNKVRVVVFLQDDSEVYESKKEKKLFFAGSKRSMSKHFEKYL